MRTEASKGKLPTWFLLCFPSLLPTAETYSLKAVASRMHSCVKGNFLWDTGYKEGARVEESSGVPREVWLGISTLRQEMERDRQQISSLEILSTGQITHSKPILREKVMKVIYIYMTARPRLWPCPILTLAFYIWRPSTDWPLIQ